MAERSSIVGSIVERKPTSGAAKPKSSISSNTGFPTVQHRSKSAFGRSREGGRKPGLLASGSRVRNPPVIAVSSNLASPKPASTSGSLDWRDQISKENEARVADMEEDEREEERRQILERFGSNIGNVLRRARMAREEQKEKDQATTNLPTSKEDSIPITEERRPVERGTTQMYPSFCQWV